MTPKKAFKLAYSAARAAADNPYRKAFPVAYNVAMHATYGDSAVAVAIADAIEQLVYGRDYRTRWYLCGNEETGALSLVKTSRPNRVYGRCDLPLSDPAAMLRTLRASNCPVTIRIEL